MTMHRFYANPATLHDEHVILDTGETRHLRDVLRLGEGENVIAFDGRGREYLCTITEIGKDRSELLVISEQQATSPESSLDLTLAATMLKGEKFDLVVQKAVELGVRKLVPIRTARTDVRSKDSTKRVVRWRKIAMEASKQSGRAFVMDVAEPVEFTTFCERLEPETFLFSERDGEKFPNKLRGEALTAIVGPEGGWDDQELSDAKAAGAKVITFGGRILRAETAAISIAAILQHRFGDLN